jgi:D-xylose 1-dehydrogenase (NADP+, D-xylono-1,5-lactone-forming)
MEKQIRWGIISTANIARKAMIPALKESPMAEVIAVSSRTAENAHACADELGIPKAYEGYETLLSDPQVEAVYNPLPNHLHKEWTIRAAEAGKHILCEKPLGLNPEECLEMIAAARANGVQLLEAFMYRYHPRILAARQMLQSGVIGEVKTIESAFCFKLKNKNDIRYQPEMGGGALMDVGCYCVNISRLMAGREPVAVQARAHWSSTGVDDQLTGILDFGDGLMAHFDCALNQERRERCILAGTEGHLELPMTFVPVFGESLIHEALTGRTANKGTDTSIVHTFPAVNTYRLVAEDLMQAIDGKPPAFPIEDAVGNMRVIQALLASARQNGHPVAPNTW